MFRNALPRILRACRSRAQLCLVVAMVAVIAGCRRDRGATGVQEELGVASELQQFPCVLQYTVVSLDEDSVLLRHGIPTTVDTTEVCQTWTGTDYDLHTVEVGSSMNHDVIRPSPVAGTEWHSGVLRTLDTAGREVEGALVVGGRSMDVLGIDEATQAAVADDPYASVVVPGECVVEDGETFVSCSADACADELIVCDGEAATMSLSSQPLETRDASKYSVAERARQPRIVRKGIRRRLEHFTEQPSAVSGRRVFTRGAAGAEERITIHAATQLPILYETRSARDHVRQAFAWRQSKGMFVRSETSEEYAELKNGRMRVTAVAHERLRDVRFKGARILD